MNRREFVAAAAALAASPLEAVEQPQSISLRPVHRRHGDGWRPVRFHQLVPGEIFAIDNEFDKPLRVCERAVPTEDGILSISAVPIGWQWEGDDADSSGDDSGSDQTASA